MEFVKNTELKLAMAFLRKACGYERYLRVRAAQEGKTDLTEWQEVLDFITEDAGRYRSLEEWQEAQELYREQLQCRETVRSGMQKKQEKQENSGITLLTVHAAKGLEFDHVIMPYCDWQLEKANTIWCTPQEAPYNELPLVPVDFSAKQMKGSIYEDDYRESSKNHWKLLLRS